MTSDDLRGLGLNVGLAVAGFFGSLLMVGKTASASPRTTATAIVAGVAAANYLTPMVVDLVGTSNPHAGYSVGFLLGFLGLRGVELAAGKLAAKLEEK